MSTAPAQITAPSPTTSGSKSAAERAARERAPNAGGLPSTAPSCTTTPAPSTTPEWITTFPPSTTSSGSPTSEPSSSPGARSDGCSTRALLERALKRVEHPHDPQSRGAVGARPRPRHDALDEVPALDRERLLVRDPGAAPVAGALDVLAVGGEVLVEALVVHLQLLLDLHVVERRHLLRADHREATLLVRVEPRQMQ